MDKKMLEAMENQPWKKSWAFLKKKHLMMAMLNGQIKMMRHEPDEVILFMFDKNNQHRQQLKMTWNDEKKEWEGITAFATFDEKTKEWSLKEGQDEK